MKRLSILLLLSPLFMAMTCDEDPGYLKFGIDGDWFLVNITDTVAGTSTDFERGFILWNFDETYRSLYITNNNPTDVYDGPESLISGQYEFSQVPDVCNRSLIVNDIEYGCIERNGDSLVISNEHANGHKFILIR